MAIVLEPLVEIHGRVFLRALLSPAHEIQHRRAIWSLGIHDKNRSVVVQLHVEVVFVGIHDWVKCAQILEPSDHPRENEEVLVVAKHMRLPQVCENILPSFYVELHRFEGLSHPVEIKRFASDLKRWWPRHVEMFVDPLPACKGVVELEWRRLVGSS